MKNSLGLVIFLILLTQYAGAQEPRSVISLNGTWEFDQTLNAFPPSNFTRKIPVPGLIHLAEPRIEEYDKFFKRPGKAKSVEQFNLYNLDYTPRYSWYRKTVFINLTDERYVKQAVPHKPGEILSFKLVKINDVNKDVSGKVTLKILDSYGKTVSRTSLAVAFSAFERTSDLAEISLPKKPGGYLLTAEFIANGTIDPIISRRYIKVGKVPEYNFFEIKTSSLK